MVEMQWFALGRSSVPHFSSTENNGIKFSLTKFSNLHIRRVKAEIKKESIK